MAEFDLQNTNITILGQWNVAIISPLWIRSQFPEFYSTDEIPIQIGIMNHEIRFEIKNLVINVNPNHLVISPKVETDESFNNLITLSNGIVEKLSHTPIIAVGSNFT